MKKESVSEYAILPEMELILQIHKGNIEYENIKNLKCSICDNKDYRPNFNFIIDIRDATVAMSREELIEYGEFVIDKLNPQCPIKLAVLSKTPEHVASTMVFQLNLKSKFLRYEAFSTVSGALKWLGISNNRFNSLTLEAIISNMKGEPIIDLG